VSDPRRRWTKQRLRELSLILWTAWDPVGVEGVPLNEYENYAPRIASVLERGGDVPAVAEALSQIRAKYMGGDRDPDRDREAAGKIVQWFRVVTGELAAFEGDGDV
jgi:hypothetical protein